MRTRYALTSSLLICGLALTAGAAPLVVDDGERVSPGGDLSDQTDMPDVAAQPDGSYLVVWGEDYKAYARGFDAEGRPRGGAQLLSFSQHAFELGGMPRAAALPDGRFVVVWVATWTEYQPRPIGSRSFTRIVMRVLDGAGTPLGAGVEVGAFAPAPITGGEQPPLRGDPPPSVVVDRAGVVAVAWSFVGQLQMRRHDASGAELHTIDWPGGFPILDLGRGLEAQLAVVPGGWVLARVLDSHRVSIERLDADARPRGPAWTYTLTLRPGYTYQRLYGLRAVADESGRFLLVWHETAFDTEHYPQGRILDRVRAQRFAADGRTVGDIVDLLFAERAGRYPDLEAFVLGDVEARHDGTFLLTWSVGRTYDSCGGVADPYYPCWFYDVESDVDAAVFAADGTLLAQADVAAGAPVVRAAGAAAAGDGWVVVTRDGYDGPVDAAALSFAACGDVAGALCLANRFRLQVEWSTGGAAGAGTPLSVSSDTGAFWFFSPSNVELVAKVLDGTGVNGKHWVFFASLTDVEFDLVVTDTATGAVKRYHNPQGTLASRADTAAFDGGASLAATAGPRISALGAALERAPAAVAAAETASACPAGALCLAGGRFLVTAKWRLDNGEGAATPIGWTAETGTFWFFSPSNVELAVKVLDGRGVNGRFWVLFASLSDVDFDLEVLDTTTGARRTYHNPRGTMASRADVEAF